MTKLGFNSVWVDLVMRCVRRVSYSVLVNGTPSAQFNPERGLRQGDPLSPYLFLMCAEVFTTLLRKSELEGKIHGVAVARQVPRVSHLFFADDTILFIQTNTQEADEIMRIIGVYEATSGQRINLDKTEITVSSNIAPDKHKELSNRMGVRDVEKHGKYLGLPTLIGRVKRNIFCGVVEKVSNKLKDWKEKFLSQAGKEVLIKTVIQAIPTYAMSCFLIPNTTCQDVEKEEARFFWGSTPEERKCYWASWDKLTASKEKGGMGFRELHYFNIAMFAKQLWLLMKNPNSIFSRILRAKYNPHGDLLNAGPGYNPS